MKYQVQIKYTNPAHEHVSLRRRVETITRLVEASSETEAINRAANQQRSLGFMIKEADILKPDVAEKSEPKEKKKKKVVGDDTENTDVAAASGSVKEDSDKKDDKETKKMQDKLESGRMSPSEVEKKLKKEEKGGTASYPLLKKGEKLKPMKLKEGFDPDPSDIAAHLVKKHGKGKVTKDHVDAYEKDRDSNKAIDKEAVMKHIQKMSEDVEQIEEGFNKSSAAHMKARDLVSRSSMKAVYHSDGSATIHATGDKNVSSATKVDHIYRDAGLDHNKPASAYKNSSKSKGGLTFKSKETGNNSHEIHISHKGMKEEVELDEAQKKLKPSYWKAEWRLGTQTEVDKNNKKIYDRLAKTDPVKAAAFHDNLMKLKKKDVKEEVVAEASKEGENVIRGMRASMKAMDLRHGVDSDKRVSGYKMSPVVRAAQKKSDALSKVVKRPQAGTLAAVHKSMEREMMRNIKEEVEYIEEKLTAADPASKWIHDFVKSDNPKFAGKSKKERINMALGAHYAAKRAKNEEVDLDESKHEGKKESRKTGEKREDILQGKVNKINMTPELDQKINGVK